MAGEFVIGNMIAKLAADTSDFIKDMSGASKVAKDFKKDAGAIDEGAKGIKGAFSGISTAVKGFLAGGALVSAGYALVSFMKSSVAEAEAAAKAQAQLEAVIRSTGGAAGVTAGDVNDLADELSGLTGIEDDLIVKQSAVMLTFTKVSDKVFPDAVEAALDMSAAMGQDLQSSIVQVGKALNDPIEGVGALRRVGVQLTDQQQDLIKSLVESGKEYEAQQIILGELQTEFGGTAKAMHEAGSGSDSLKNSLGNLKEEIGKGLIPATRETNLEFASWLDTLSIGISAQNALLQAERQGIITTEERARQLELMVTTSYEASDAIDWLKTEVEKYNQEQARMHSFMVGFSGIAEGYTSNIDSISAEEDVLAAAQSMVNTELRKSKELQASVNSLNEKAPGIYGELAAALAKSNVPLFEKNRLLDELRIKSGETTAKELEMQRQIDILTLSFEAGAISEAEYKKKGDELARGITTTAFPAIDTLKSGMKDLASNTQTAIQKAYDLRSEIEKLKSKTITIKVLMQTTKTYKNQTGQGYGGQHGLDTYIPPGFPNDTFPVWTSSGEHVTVTPPGKSEPGGGGDTYIEINNYNQQAAALSLAMLMNSRLSRLNASMG